MILILIVLLSSIRVNQPHDLRNQNSKKLFQIIGSGYPYTLPVTSSAYTPPNWEGGEVVKYTLPSNTVIRARADYISQRYVLTE